MRGDKVEEEDELDSIDGAAEIVVYGAGLVGACGDTADLGKIMAVSAAEVLGEETDSM